MTSFIGYISQECDVEKELPFKRKTFYKIKMAIGLHVLEARWLQKEKFLKIKDMKKVIPERPEIVIGMSCFLQKLLN